MIVGALHCEGILYTFVRQNFYTYTPPTLDYKLRITRLLA